jgi:hypothetical protein
MDGIEQDNEFSRLLHLVESAQRAGYSEREIVEVVESALGDDGELDRAA